jgi:hypothetical protein
MTKKRIGKFAGYISTLAIFVIGITPSTFNIPVVLRPWIFLASIVWFVTFSSGVFSS